jgi:subtilisin family serine protease
MVLYDASGKIVASALANRTGGDPVQIMRFTNATAGTAFRLAIITNGGSAAPDLFKYIGYGHGLTIGDANAGIGSGSVVGHEDMAGVNSVGAIAAAAAPAFGGGGAVEGFTSVGPGTILLDAQGNRLTDAVTGNKVDFVAPDGVATSVFPSFYGTSAAAPDAAAVAALMLQAHPGLTPAQVTAMLGQSAVAVTGPAGGIGAGLIQAPAGVQLAEAVPRVAMPDAAPVAAVAAAQPGVTTAWSTGTAATPVERALATVGQGGGVADFFAQLDPGAVASGWQDTTATAFALMDDAAGLVVPIPGDVGGHALV